MMWTPVVPYTQCAETETEWPTGGWRCELTEGHLGPHWNGLVGREW